MSRPPDPAVLAQFDTTFTQLRLRLSQAGVAQIADSVLHHVDQIKVSSEMYFNRLGRVEFAFMIGTSGPNKIFWVCSNGSVIMSFNGRPEIIYSSSNIQFEMLETINWPLALRGHLVSPLGPEIKALVLFDIVRWVEKNKTRRFSNIKNVVFPDADRLIAALRKFDENEIFQAHSSTEQLASPPPRGRSTGILPSGPPQEEGFKRSGALPPKQINQVASEGIAMSPDHNTQEGEILEQGVVFNNEVEMTVDGGLKLEEEQNIMPVRASSEPGSEPEQRGSPVFLSRVNGVNGIATSRVLRFAVENELIFVLPDITAFHFSEQTIEDYYPIRLQIGVCREEKTGNLHYLWIYLKWNKPSPHVDYIIDGTVSAQDAELMAGSSKGNRRSITHEQLWKMLNENMAELYPLFSPLGTQKQELQALAKYGYILAAESQTIHGLSPDDNTIPINPTFSAHLQKVCENFESEPVNYWSRSFSLPLQFEEKGRDRSTNIGQDAALHAKDTGHTDLNKLPHGVLRDLEGASSPITVMAMRPSSPTSRFGNNLGNTTPQLAEQDDSDDNIVTSARRSQVRGDDAPPPEGNESEDHAPRRRRRLRAARDRAPPNNEIVPVRDEPMNDPEATQERDEVMQDFSGDAEPVPEHLPPTAPSNAASRAGLINRVSSATRSENCSRACSVRRHSRPSSLLLHRREFSSLNHRDATRSDTASRGGSVLRRSRLSSPLSDRREPSSTKLKEIDELRRVANGRIEKDRARSSANAARILECLQEERTINASREATAMELARANDGLRILLARRRMEYSPDDGASEGTDPGQEDGGDEVL
jgi:hypothetical protein